MAKKKITRSDAQERGLTRYYTGVACRAGHRAERFTSNKTCVRCESIRNTENNRNANPTFKKLKSRERNLRDRYGITLGEYSTMVDKQDGRCAICGNLARDMSVDHCHRTNKVRGLLCTTCNGMIGFANDSIKLLQLATDYLVRHG